MQWSAPSSREFIIIENKSQYTDRTESMIIQMAIFAQFKFIGK